MQKNYANCVKIIPKLWYKWYNEKGGEDILFLIKRCIRKNIHVTDIAEEHYGEKGKPVTRKYKNTRRKHEKALQYF